MDKGPGRFKQRTADILTGPGSMREFLSPENPQIQKDVKPSLPIAVETQNQPTVNTPKEAVERLHLQIRRDLAHRLFSYCAKLKLERSVKRRDASQKAVVEKALEDYFNIHDE
jgi:hypothetical protein